MSSGKPDKGEGKARLLATARAVDLAMLEHLGEIESLELHLKSGYNSLFKMCTEKFRLSEAALAVASKLALGLRLPASRGGSLNPKISDCESSVFERRCEYVHTGYGGWEV